jgi:pyruvate dehydrogenase E2 component (dihydrolipoamide acetyltransferase)
VNTLMVAYGNCLRFQGELVVSESSDTVIAVAMPQVNVNDEEVTLVGWHVEDGGQIAAGDPLCEIETSKSTGDVPSPATGVFLRMVEVGQVVAVGQVIGHVGPSLDAIRKHLDTRTSTSAATSPAGPIVRGAAGATAGAIELARSYGIDTSAIPAEGRVRRSDVERYLADHPELQKRPAGAAQAAAVETLPAGLRTLVADEGDLPDHHWSIAQHLAATHRRLSAAHVAMDVAADRLVRWIETQRQAGRMTGPIPLLLHAAAQAARSCPALVSFRLGRRVYRYRSIDIAFTARSADGRLFTPVVRDVPGRSLTELAERCAALSMAVFRGQLEMADMAGGAMTVSALSDLPVRFHVGLQNAYQSALLTAGAIHDEVVLIDGKPTLRPTMTLVLSYDHGLMDGYEAASALAAAKTALENLVV